MSAALAIWIDWLGLVVALGGCILTPRDDRALSLFYPAAAAAFIYVIGRQMIG